MNADIRFLMARATSDFPSALHCDLYEPQKKDTVALSESCFLSLISDPLPNISREYSLGKTRGRLSASCCAQFQAAFLSLAKQLV